MSAADGSTDSDTDQSTRDRLLDAAIDIAGETGLQAVTYRAVAARVGMAHGLVRHHFGTREQLLVEAFRRAATQDSDQAGLAANSIDEFAAGLVETLNGSRRRQLLQYDETTQAVRGNLPIENVRGLYRRYTAQVGGTLHTAGVPDPDGSVSGLVFSALDGIVLQHMIFADDDRTSQLLEQLREVLRRMVR
ncbi:TetR/AcrR family transcriptional regulator [Rhodococcus sp. BP-349]|uniref:TetR/AcrR family transcriptional regulator n=1 Tax=unclassified Rhodococcus (in: high G+C Gram-positive bacteria) TaxID=192944 RepID=UPI001C9AE1BC|nr:MULTISPECIES: TetR/AcrR family transcriptional regulator [unclassified Rhodococcus (in: high G+C Gram-positive bacteria)]MBY6537928.1 TetR/AcrR family transcriptional regulator [Rhodococcus sp. BP-363]MBY6542265.1 TetR/AcrR family transcriptional regulator [Rhodococcus sp. BP-369]MBY6561495.1 TetR/AcrR family transcriptional regulator [Rhodococcus sp. BP-370]MBY6575787.1 TetR/AcrR family transcriptional regulator [Rhodococcus sp. BP-364]MBY6585088.1 TetR/AcrR family transcriptional regulato